MHRDLQFFVFMILPLAMVFVAVILIGVRRLAGGQVGLYVTTLIAGAVFLAMTGQVV